MIHSTYRPQSGSIVQILAPTPITIPGDADYDNTERLAAVSHAECDKYWVIAQDGRSNRLHAILVASDARPATVVTSTSSLQQSGSWEGGAMKVSPDGTTLAFADFASRYVALMAFDRATGLISDMHRIEEVACYGIEFSPDSKTLYVAALSITNMQSTSDVRAHTIANGAQSAAALTVVLPQIAVGAMQLAPNDKIYGRILNGAQLMEIGQPNTPNAPAATNAATYADGSVITLSPQNEAGGAGLPAFTRQADDCRIQRSTCEEMSSAVNGELSQQASAMQNQLRPCDDGAAHPAGEDCKPLDLPEITPVVRIAWGQSACDGMEDTDTEVMTITICNPYSNLTLSGLTVMHMGVVMPDGSEIPALPGGDASVTLVPRGPQCFGDIAPCACVSREFTLRTRGAKPGEYRIEVSGICFDVCLHSDSTACFILPVCED